MKKRLVTCIVAVVIFISVLFSKTGAYAATTLEEAKFILDMYFVDQLSDEARQAATMEQLINAIGDPYTTYMSPEAFEKFVEAVENEFSGIGVTVEQSQEGVLVISVLKDSGAEAAGLKPGDIILEANGRILKEMDLPEALTYIIGEEGTYVNLKIKRENQQFNVQVERSRLVLPTVEGELLEGNIGYIRIYSFGSDTDEEFGEYLKEFEAKNPAGYVIDIRSNGGGYIDTALKIAGYFIGDNVAMLTSSKWGIEQYTAIGDDIMINRPVFLLVDEFSASASEILGGALQDYGKALLTGNPTFGKGTMQTIFPLSDEGVLKVTTNYTYTPSGRSFNHVGLEPDIETGEEGDPYYAALLLLWGDAENKKSKQGYMGIEVDGVLYDISLEQARQDEYWESYRTLINDAMQKGRDVLIGTAEGWKPFGQQIWIHRYYYPNHKELPLLADIEPDKVFSITFSQPVDPDTLNDKIYLIDSNTGERINCKVEEIDDTGEIVKVTAVQLLEGGREYYLVIDKGIQALAGGNLEQGVLCRAKVAD